MSDNLIRISVDLETMALATNAAIVQIAASVIEPTGNDMERPNFNVYINPDAYTATPAGAYSIDKETMEWWDKQDPAVRQRVFSGTTPIALALGLFSDWCIGLAVGDWKRIRIYSKGSVDWYWLTNAYEQEFGKMPFHYRSPCDMRTLKDVLTYAGYSIPLFKPEFPHDALSDAVAQAQEIEWCLSVVSLGAQ